jgi:uncharacterized membrane protein YidH (DUF202 family)
VDDERDTPWDPGLQLERTTLAWLRTTLAFIVGGIVVLRVIAHRNIVLASVGMALILPLAGFITWLSWRRHQRSEHRLRADAPLPDGVLPAAVATLGVLVGCVGVAFVLIQ